MNLLPIIYASLLIFGSLFLIVLVTSYISYKVKQNNGMALATANTRNFAQKNNYIGETAQDKVQIIRKSAVNKEMQNNSVNMEEKFELMTPQHNLNENPVNDKLPDIKKSRSARMTVIQDIRTNNNVNRQIRERVAVQKPALTYSPKSNILRFYEDF